MPSPRTASNVSEWSFVRIASLSERRLRSIPETSTRDEQHWAAFPHSRPVSCPSENVCQTANPNLFSVRQRFSIRFPNGPSPVASSIANVVDDSGMLFAATFN